MAGFFAERGYLKLPGVVACAFGGAYVGHVFWFFLGRKQGIKLLERFPKMKKHFGKGIRMFERYGAPAIFITQWLYGLRITCAVIIGMSRISVLKFILYEAVSCAAWSVVITALGYYFGRAIDTLLGRVENIEKYALGFIAAIAIGFWLWHRWKEKKEEQVDG
jgi:membrane protein DedA with SNARE-associated domain